MEAAAAKSVVVKGRTSKPSRLRSDRCCRMSWIPSRPRPERPGLCKTPFPEFYIARAVAPFWTSRRDRRFRIADSNSAGPNQGCLRYVDSAGLTPAKARTKPYTDPSREPIVRRNTRERISVNQINECSIPRVKDHQCLATPWYS